MKTLNRYLKSKTVWFGTLLIVFGTMQEALPQLRGLIPDKAYEIATAVVGVTVIVLRAITTTSLAEKEK